MEFNLEQVGNDLLTLIKKQAWFPHNRKPAGGTLKFKATIGSMQTDTTYRIHFSGVIAPYVEYLEEGTRPHDIPHAFGYGTIRPDKPNPYTHKIPYGVGGRFEGKFHPGSTKHQGFIKDKCIHAIIDYITTRFDGELL